MTAPRAAISVLIVEDDDILRHALRTYVSHLECCQVRVAATVAEARALLEAAPADLAFVDYRLPDGTGAEVAAAAHASGRVRAIYAMTGVATCDHVVAAMRAGCLDVLEKPFNLDKIATLIAAHRPAP